MSVVHWYWYWYIRHVSSALWHHAYFTAKAPWPRTCLYRLAGCCQIVAGSDTSVTGDQQGVSPSETLDCLMSWTEPSIRLVSSSRVGLVVGKKPNPWKTYPVADLALEVAGGWWTRFTQIPFSLQLLNASYFKLFYSWLACGTPTSSVHRECFQFRGCDSALSHCGL